MADKEEFDVELVRSYPRSLRKINVGVKTYSIAKEETDYEETSLTTYISPHGMEFHGTLDYPSGTLLKIDVNLPDYWNRKQRFVEYNRVDSPQQFKVLAKVIKTEEIGKRGKKKLVLVQTVNIDEVDEKVLKSFLQETK